MNKWQKKLLSFMVVAFLAVFLGTMAVDAACTYKEKANLNEIARKVKTSYEITERKEKKTVTSPDTDEEKVIEKTIPEFKISIYNLTEDLYVTQENSFTRKITNIYNSMTKDGLYTFVDADLGNIVTYTYKVYSNLEGCRGEVLRTYTIKKPKQNDFAKMELCDGLSAISYCKPYLTDELKGVTESNISRLIDEALNDKKDNPNKKKDEEAGVLTFLKDNWLYTLIGVGLVAGATGGTIYFVKKRSAL